MKTFYDDDDYYTPQFEKSDLFDQSMARAIERMSTWKSAHGFGEQPRRDPQRSARPTGLQKKPTQPQPPGIGISWHSTDGKWSVQIYYQQNRVKYTVWGGYFEDTPEGIAEAIRVRAELIERLVAEGKKSPGDIKKYAA